MNKTLPIFAFAEKITSTINQNPVTIIAAETGSGKTTQVVQMIMEETDYEVVITQPRRLPARTVSERVANEMGVVFGTAVGYRTAEDRKDSIDTRCLFCTDGLQLVRELTKKSKKISSQGIVLIIDEVHEWNINIETLVAWCRNMIVSKTANIKIVLMSATIDHAGLSEHFFNAPVIKVPGRMFPVKGSPYGGGIVAQRSSSELIDEIIIQVNQGKNVLVFLAGKPEIAAVEKDLLDIFIKAHVLQLHGDLSPSDQAKVFSTYTLPKVILSTNIAQTSITIADIHHVVDSGLEKVIELRNGVETLTLNTISKSDAIQRAGRAGRVGPGGYTLCNDKMYDFFDQYSTPDIKRLRLDQMVLRLAAASLDATELQFYHQPDIEQLVLAKKTLIVLGALDEKGNITSLGREINTFPTSVRTARMIIEATKQKCLSTMLTIAAIMETNYGTIKYNPRSNDPYQYRSWRELVGSKKYSSDLLCEFDLYTAAKNIGYNRLEERGISKKGYGIAVEIRGQLHNIAKDLGYDEKKESANSQNEEAVLKCILSGMIDCLYYNSYGRFTDGQSDRRDLDKNSVLNSFGLFSSLQFVVGKPKNITIKSGRYGMPRILNLLTNCTTVKPSWIDEIAPGLITETVVAQSSYLDNIFPSLQQKERYQLCINGYVVSPPSEQSIFA